MQDPPATKKQKTEPSKLSISDLCSSDQMESTVYYQKEQEVAQFLSEMRSEEPQKSFLNRVKQLPMVNETIKTINDVYENSKNTSKIMKYSAETVESGVKSILDTSKPVLSRLEPSLGQLDEFACRQLDKLQKNYPIIMEPTAQVYSTGKEAIGQAIHRPASMVSRWNSYMSEESMKSLKFCMDWLQYATSHIDLQIQRLSQALAQLVPTQSLHALAQISVQVKREVIETLRKVVDVIGRYAGHALPLEARNAVRGFILQLPSRWQYVSQNLPVLNSNGEWLAQQEANRVLSLAQESHQMLKSTQYVFDQTVSTAEYWLGGSSTSSTSNPQTQTQPPQEQ